MLPRLTFLPARLPILGPELEVYREQSGDLSFGEDYLESGVKADIDVVSADVVFGSLESVTGLRNIENEGELRTDFVFERLDLLANWKLPGSVNWNILLSAEWEWHDMEEENNQIFLVSTGLYYTF